MIAATIIPIASPPPSTSSLILRLSYQDLRAPVSTLLIFPSILTKQLIAILIILLSVISLLWSFYIDTRQQHRVTHSTTAFDTMIPASSDHRSFPSGFPAEEPEEDFHNTRNMAFIMNSYHRPKSCCKIPRKFRSWTSVSCPSTITIVVMLLYLLQIISLASGNVPQPFPPEDNTFQTSRPSLSPEVEDPSVQSLQPRTAPAGMQRGNMTNSHQDPGSMSHEATESSLTPNLRYAVASFDFHHVATPYIISLWIIIVGLAKIGEQRILCLNQVGSWQECSTCGCLMMTACVIDFRIWMCDEFWFDHVLNPSGCDSVVCMHESWFMLYRYKRYIGIRGMMVMMARMACPVVVE